MSSGQKAWAMDLQDEWEEANRDKIVKHKELSKIYAPHGEQIYTSSSGNLSLQDIDYFNRITQQYRLHENIFDEPSRLLHQAIIEKLLELKNKQES